MATSQNRQGRAGRPPDRRPEGRLALATSIAALIVSVFAAAGTWAQVGVEKQAVSDHLYIIDAEVDVYDLNTKEYTEIDPGKIAPTPDGDKTLLYFLITVGNSGRAGGSITDLGVRTKRVVGIRETEPNCDDNPKGDKTISCALPIALASNERKKIYVNVSSGNKLGCSGNSDNLVIWFDDAQGHEQNFDTKVKSPYSPEICKRRTPSR